MEIKDYTEDVQAWIKNYEWPAAKKKVREGERYTNSFGKEYLILKDSEEGQDTCLVRAACYNGFARRLIPKALLFI